jgi:hypothetical protein
VFHLAERKNIYVRYETFMADKYAEIFTGDLSHVSVYLKTNVSGISLVSIVTVIMVIHSHNGN